MWRYMAFLVVSLLASSAAAQEWATKLFKQNRHDFGTVARNAKTEFVFEMTNLYREDVHISDVRASCGCTTPSIVVQTLKTGETGGIRARFNSHSFSGQGNATLTVTIDRPQYAEVQLTVSGYIRDDISVNPGQFELGEVDLGAGTRRAVAVHVGSTDGRIMQLKPGSPLLKATAVERQRAFDGARYDVTVELVSTAPAGDLNTEVLLVTSQGQIPVPVTGRVLSPVQVSPALLYVGAAEPGQKVTKQLIVRGKQPFKVLEVVCGDSCFEFKTTEDAKAMHMIPVTFHAAQQTGKVQHKIDVKTDLGGGASGSCTVWAHVIAKK